MSLRTGSHPFPRDPITPSYGHVGEVCCRVLFWREYLEPQLRIGNLRRQVHGLDEYGSRTMGVQFIPRRKR